MFAGGNTIRAGGGFNAAIKADYEKAGIKDSPDLHAQQTLAAGDGRGDPVLVHQLTEKAPESVQWLKDHGVKFEDHIYQIYAGLYKRARNPYTSRHFLKSARKKTFLSSTTPASSKSSVNIS